MTHYRKLKNEALPKTTELICSVVFGIDSGNVIKYDTII